jgi:hypothetical protein
MRSSRSAPFEAHEARVLLATNTRNAQAIQPKFQSNHLEQGAIMNATVLWVIAVILAIVGIVQLLQGQILLGIVLLIGAALVGPGGYSVFRSRT